MKETGGKLDELNSILSSTQQKLNRFGRATRCSLSNIFNRSGSADVNDGQQQSQNSPNLKDPVNRRNTTVMGNTSEINAALTASNNNNYEGEDCNVSDKTSSSNQSHLQKSIAKNMTSHLDKLDSLINKAEQAELSMAHQSKQMRKMIK